MKQTIAFTTATALFLAASNVGNAAPKEDVVAAAKKLGEQSGYSWHTSTQVPEGGRFRPGPQDGKTEKDGATYVTMTFGDNTTEIAKQGDKAAITRRDGGWASASELEDAEGPGRFLGAMARNLQVPSEQAAEIAAGAKELKQEGDVILGELTVEGAKALMSFRRRGGGGDGPEIEDAKGSVKFWIKDGVLSKYEYKVQGVMIFNDNEREIDRTTTVEIKDVGATKVTLPEEAKKKLS